MLTWDDIDEQTQLPVLEYDVTATTIVVGALASRDYRPMHHDHVFATERNGTADIFLNTPTQAGWFGRYITDWAGTSARIGSLSFRMNEPIFPGERMRITGTIAGRQLAPNGCAWVALELQISTGSVPDGSSLPNTTCRAVVALPKTAADDPWQRHGHDWSPDDIKETQWI